MKYNIPARTLRDWMKRLNIKSVFTHNHSTSSSNQNQSKISENISTTTDSMKQLSKANVSVTSVELPESTIAIKDIIKLPSTNCNASPGGVVKTEKNNVIEGQEIERAAIKIENDANNIVSIKLKTF